MNIDNGSVVRLKPGQIGEVVFGWMWYRRVTMLMLFVALIASLFPLTLLWKVRGATVDQIHGVIERQPGLRELFPGELLKSQAWFEGVKNWPEVDYLIPGVLNGMVTVEVADEFIDLVPSSNGDPVLGKLSSNIYEGDWIVLSQSAAEKLNSQEGDPVVLEIYRDNGTEYRTLEFSNIGVLEHEKDELSRGYVALEFLEQLEQYRSGYAVPVRDWASREGQGLFAAPLFDGILVASRSSRDMPSKLDFMPITGKRAAELLGVVAVPPGAYGILLNDKASLVSEQYLEFHRQIVEAKASKFVALLPFIDLPDRDTSIRTITNSSTTPDNELSVSLFSELETFAKLMEVSDALIKMITDNSRFRRAIEIPIFNENGRTVCVDGFLKIIADNQIAPCHVDLNSADYQSGVFVLSRIKGAVQQGLTYHVDAGWQKQTREYPGLRVFAQNLSDIEVLQRKLANEGVTTITNQSFAASFLELDKSLRKWLVALTFLIVIGTVSVVALNFGAMVRMQTDTYALLRLYGVSAVSVCLLPCFYVLVTIIPAWLVAEVLAMVVANPVSQIFGLLPDTLSQEESSWYYEGGLDYSLMVLAVILFISISVSYVSTYRLLKQPISELF